MSNDLSVIIGLGIGISIFVVLTALFFNNPIQNDIPQYQEETGIFTSLIGTGNSFLSYFSTINNKFDNPYATSLIVAPIGFIVLVLGLRFIWSK